MVPRTLLSRPARPHKVVPQIDSWRQYTITRLLLRKVYCDIKDLASDSSCRTSDGNRRKREVTSDSCSERAKLVTARPSQEPLRNAGLAPTNFLKKIPTQPCSGFAFFPSSPPGCLCQKTPREARPSETRFAMADYDRRPNHDRRPRGGRGRFNDRKRRYGGESAFE